MSWVLLLRLACVAGPSALTLLLRSFSAVGKPQGRDQTAHPQAWGVRGWFLPVPQVGLKEPAAHQFPSYLGGRLLPIC